MQQGMRGFVQHLLFAYGAGTSAQTAIMMHKLPTLRFSVMQIDYSRR